MTDDEYENLYEKYEDPSVRRLGDVLPVRKPVLTEKQAGIAIFVGVALLLALIIKDPATAGEVIGVVAAIAWLLKE